jgi:hypothetical protein
MSDESPAQRRLRLYREEKARKKASRETKLISKAQRNQELKALREANRELKPDLVELGSRVKENTMRQKTAYMAASAARAAKVAERTRWRLCKCCGDDKDIKQNGMCEQCWLEKTYGVIQPPGVSERQLKSAECRNVRKGHEMS